MIPTTAGTGSEATPNSIVAVPEEQLKVGIVNPEMIADAVVLDGNMIRRLPRKLQPLPASTRCATPLNATPPRRQIRSVTCSQCRRCGSSFGILKKPATTRMHWMQKKKMMQAAFYAGAPSPVLGHGCACAVLPSGRAIPHPAWRCKCHYADAGHAVLISLAAARNLQRFMMLLEAREPAQTQKRLTGSSIRWMLW